MDVFFLLLVLLVTLHTGNLVGLLLPRIQGEKYKPETSKYWAEKLGNSWLCFIPRGRHRHLGCNFVWCAYVCVRLHKRIHVRVYICMCTSVCTGIHVCACVCMCVSVCIYMCVWRASFILVTIPCSHDVPVFATTVAVPCRCSWQAANFIPRVPFSSHCLWLYDFSPGILWSANLEHSIAPVPKASYHYQYL